MTKIKSLKALEILDSRGYPTLEVILTTTNGISVKSKVPSGASTGENEACELRDNDPNRFFGKGVLKAKGHVEKELQALLIGKSVLEQKERDLEMIKADGSENKSNFGANAILAVSMCIARAAAEEKKLPLYRSIFPSDSYKLPIPMMNLINGGAHADNDVEIQEFMIFPQGASTYSEALRWGSEIFFSLKNILKKKNFPTAVGDEGGFAPNLKSDKEALNLLLEAIEGAKLKAGSQISLALDAAASELYDPTTNMYIEAKKKKKNLPFLQRTSKEQVEYLMELKEKFPMIFSIEDGLDENDWDGWKYFVKKMGDKLQIVGDDLFVTNPKFLKRGIEERAANAILIKLNQIGTLTETLETIEMAKKNGFKTVISHRSGETEDDFISDLAVAISAGQIKTGSLSRSERIAKYNRLLEIESELGKKALWGK